MTHLITIGTLDFAVVTRLGAIFTEMSHLIAVAACDSCWVPGFVAFFALVPFLATVAASVASTGGTVLGKVPHCKLLG